MPRATHYLSSADIAREMGVPASQVRMWRVRYSPFRSPAAIRAAASFPAPDVLVGMADEHEAGTRSLPGWKPSRLPEIKAWRDSLPGSGTGPRPAARKS